MLIERIGEATLYLGEAGEDGADGGAQRAASRAGKRTWGIRPGDKGSASIGVTYNHYGRMKISKRDRNMSSCRSSLWMGESD